MAEAPKGGAAPRGGVLMLFLDGVGLGDDDAEHNPLAAARLPALRALIGHAPTRGAPAREERGLVFRSLDAGLGHAGLPQSATGQTALLTGRNGAELMGRHYGPWPGPTLRRALGSGTLFHAEGEGAALANAYPPGYFQALGTRRLRPNAPVVAARAAEVELRDMHAYRSGAAIAPDLTGEGFARMEGGPAALEPEEAARRLAALACAHRFTFLDVWPTDRLGHLQDARAAVALLQRLDAVLAALLPLLGSVTLVLTSDHGNLEDLTTARHTRNPVPLLVVGPTATDFASAGALTDVAPAIRSGWGA